MTPSEKEREQRDIAEMWRVFGEGYDDFAAGKPCPYDLGTRDYRLWHFGYGEAKRGLERP